MKKLRFSVLPATSAMLALVSALFTFGALSGAQVFALMLLFQLAMLCLDGRKSALFMPGLSAAQIEEFEDILSGMKTYEGMFKDLSQIAKQEGGFKGVLERLARQEKYCDELGTKLRRLQKGAFMGPGGGVRSIGAKDFVSDECAAALAGVTILEIDRLPNALANLIRDNGTRQRILDISREAVGVGFGSTRTAMDPTTIPLPTVYVPQIVELVWKYGQARQYATVYPLGAGTVKLPRLKAGEDDFGYLGIGTAGMSQGVPEKRVTAELVTFTANKAGGLIRIPTEIEEDTFIPLGQFLARYIARQLAKLEDKTMFLGDGTSTYANQTGVGPYCVANNAYLQQLAAGKTKPTDATVNDFRAMRARINAAALVDDPAYYMNPTMEALLVTFNTIGQPLIYRPATGPSQPATLDGFPIRWVGALQPYSTAAAPSSFIALFGALSYWYLGERGAPRIEVSREVFFATDEIAMRALERIDTEAMAIDAMSALETAAA